MTITVLAATRLRLVARSFQDKDYLKHEVEKVMRKYNIKQARTGAPYPVEYRKEAPPPYLKDLQNDLEKLGFRFERLPIHTPDTLAVRSDGRYASADYLLDIVFRHDELTVELYY